MPASTQRQQGEGLQNAKLRHSRARSVSRRRRQAFVRGPGGDRGPPRGRCGGSRASGPPDRMTRARRAPWGRRTGTSRPRPAGRGDRPAVRSAVQGPARGCPRRHPTTVRSFVAIVNCGRWGRCRASTGVTNDSLTTATIWEDTRVGLAHVSAATERDPERGEEVGRHEAQAAGDGLLAVGAASPAHRES